MLFKKPSFYLAIIGIFVMFKLVRSTAYRPPAPPPLVEPARSPFAVSVAATGLIESVHENVKIAAPRVGLVAKVHVISGAKVKQGDILFEMDTREARAKVATTRSQLASIRAELAMEQVQADDLRDQVARITKLRATMSGYAKNSGCMLLRLDLLKRRRTSRHRRVCCNKPRSNSPC